MEHCQRTLQGSCRVGCSCRRQTCNSHFWQLLRPTPHCWTTVLVWDDLYIQRIIVREVWDCYISSVYMIIVVCLSFSTLWSTKKQKKFRKSTYYPHQFDTIQNSAQCMLCKEMLDVEVLSCNRKWECSNNIFQLRFLTDLNKRHFWVNILF